MKKNILILIVILFIVYSLLYLYNKLRKIYKKKVLNLSFWKNKYSKHHEELLEFLKEIIPYLEKWKVRYWAHAGTLLGCVRHGGFIPWDDDIDLGYIDDNNIENLKDDLINHGYQIRNNIMVHFIDSGINFGFQIINNNLNIDMFKFTLDHKNDMLNQTYHANLIWPNENYYYNEVFPLKKIKFNDIYLSFPNDSDKFCKRAFKNDYMNVLYINGPHINNFMKNIIDGIFIYSISKKKFYMKDLIVE